MQVVLVDKNNCPIDLTGNTEELEAICEKLEELIAKKDYESTPRTICGPDGTWIYVTEFFEDGVLINSTTLDSGISCDEPMPIAPDIEFLCNQDTGNYDQIVTPINEDGTPGDPVITPTDIPCTKKECLDCECWKDKFIEGGLDNTFTSFTHTNQVYTVKFDNGDVDSFTVPSATGWTDQVSQMATGLDGIMPWAQTVEPFCNFLPNGCGGLPAPFVVLNKMFARYVGFRVCPGDKVPVLIQYTSEQVKAPKKLVVQYVETETIYFRKCFDCDGNIVSTTLDDGTPYEPVCAIPCVEDFAETPLTACTTEYTDGCDNVNSTELTDFIPVVRAITDCGDGPEVSYLQEDADGALVDYTMVGIFVDCATGEPIPEPDPETPVFPVGNPKDVCYEANKGTEKTVTCLESNPDKNEDTWDITAISVILGGTAYPYTLPNSPTETVTLADVQAAVDAALAAAGTPELHSVLSNFSWGENSGHIEWEVDASPSDIDFIGNVDNNADFDECIILIKEQICVQAQAMSDGTVIFINATTGEILDSVDDWTIVTDGSCTACCDPCDTSNTDSVTDAIESLTDKMCELIGDPTDECPCPIGDENGEPIGDQVICASQKMGADFNSTAAGSGTHTAGSFFTGTAPLTSWSGTFTVTDSAGTTHTFTDGQTVTGMASGSTTAVSFTGTIAHTTDGVDYQCPVTDKLISANFVVQ